MTKLIASAIVLVALAILIMMNANFRSSVNLYGARFENISVVVIAIAGFVLGVAYSLLLYVLNFVNKQTKLNRARKVESLKQKEIELAHREETISQAEKQVQSMRDDVPTSASQSAKAHGTDTAEGDEGGAPAQGGAESGTAAGKPGGALKRLKRAPKRS